MHARQQARLIFSSRLAPWIDDTSLRTMMDFLCSGHLDNRVSGLMLNTGAGLLVCLEGDHAAITEIYTGFCINPATTRARILKVEPTGDSRWFTESGVEQVRVAPDSGRNGLDVQSLDAETARGLVEAMSRTRTPLRALVRRHEAPQRLSA